MDGGSIHHFHAGGNDAGGDDIGDAPRRIVDRGKADQQRTHGLGLRQQANRDLGDDTQQAFRPHHDAKQIEPARIEGTPAELDDLTLHRHEPHAEHVVRRQAVLEAVHAARVLGDVAADGTGDLTRRIGRVIETIWIGRSRDRKVRHPRLNDGQTILDVDLEDARKLGQHQQHRIAERQRTARERGAGTARHDAYAVLVTPAQHLRHLQGGLGQHHHER